jgi:hypothetical protein
VYHNDISFSISHESYLRLQATKTNVVVSAKAAADLLALVPLPQDLWECIFTKGPKEKPTLDRVFWDAQGDSQLTLPCFTGEFKCNTGHQNRNWLMIDIATFQSQLWALSINKII